MNNLRGKRIEFHILQSFPVTCLNRDDVGAPKSALVGGVPRARVSSQCWKRQVRMQLHDLGAHLGIRTKEVGQILRQALLKAGADETAAENLSRDLAASLTDNTLLFFSNSEADAIAQFAAEHNFQEDKLFGDKKSSEKDKKKTKGADGQEEAAGKKRPFSSDLKKVLKKALNPAADGLDIALFGRMVAQIPEMNMEAASSFSHAISTHRATNEVEFFTALDDCKTDEPGSAHMGALEYNSATYYRYVSLDLGQLYENLRGQDLGRAVELFTKALYLAVPSARQNTQAGYRLWDYARVFIRDGQGMQASFDEPVEAANGYLKPSIEALDKALKKQEAQAGSLYGKQEGFIFGLDEGAEAASGDNAVNIDGLAAGLAAYVKKFEAQA